MRTSGHFLNSYIYRYGERVAMDRFLYEEGNSSSSGYEPALRYVTEGLLFVQAARATIASQEFLDCYFVYISCFLSRWSVNRSFFCSLLRL